MASILIAEDERDLAEIWRDVLEGEGHSVTLVHSGLDAVNALASDPFDLVITDVNMPDGGGVLVANETRAADDKTHIIMLSGDPAYAKSDEFTRVCDYGHCEFLDKPIDLAQLTKKVSAALDGCDAE